MSYPTTYAVVIYPEPYPLIRHSQRGTMTAREVFAVLDHRTYPIDDKSIHEIADIRAHVYPPAAASEPLIDEITDILRSDDSRFTNARAHIVNQWSLGPSLSGSYSREITHDDDSTEMYTYHWAIINVHDDLDHRHLDELGTTRPLPDTINTDHDLGHDIFRVTAYDNYIKRMRNNDN